MTKVSVIGSGNVGATLAMRILESGLADVVMLDIAEGVCRGKAMDLTDAAPIIKHGKNITGGIDYKNITDSKVVVITAGFPRLPGMSREELISKNSSIVKEAVGNIKRYSPDAIIIIVTNPLDVMAYLAYKESGFPRGRVLGMAGVLDAARFTALLAQEAGVLPKAIEAYVVGSHGDTMVPVVSHTKINGKPLSQVLKSDKINEIVQRTKNRGAEIVGLLKSGSAYYAPSASAFHMVRAIVNNTKEIMCVSCLLEGEYGLNGIFIGVPAEIGKEGVGRIIELSLSGEEAALFKSSAEAIRKTIEKA